jgi:hypothetical protein
VLSDIAKKYPDLPTFLYAGVTFLFIREPAAIVEHVETAQRLR